MHTILFGGSVCVMYTCYSWIYGHLIAGGTLDPTGGLVDKCRDILYVNMFSMGMSLVHENFWWILVVIPLFVIYQIAAMFFNWMLTPREEVPEEQISKTQQKKQKKAEKFGYGR
mmetsp:Transcript_67886/g.99291  ORF Transcript_67886/g.99291 Transcript_67886/m.99291 type:complete len:114 (+) Transcript_67886:143-484(+)